MIPFLFLVVVALVGLVLWLAAAGKASDVGRVMFFCAFLAICFGASPAARWLR